MKIRTAKAITGRMTGCYSPWIFWLALFAFCFILTLACQCKHATYRNEKGIMDAK